MEAGYLWNSNTFAYDLPFVWEEDGRTLVELPRQPFGDGWIYGSMNSAGNPSVALTVWKSLFDELYEESGSAPAYCPFVMHPYISSRPGRARVLGDIIQYIKKHEGVWFATGSEVAEWWLKQGFSREVAPQASGRVAVGSRG
jgi:peptidoglycan/xylan/chitin deacetylase (PgdA/CDA1 family)